MAQRYSYESFTITAGGGAETASVTSNTENVIISSSGTITLGAAYTLTHSGTPTIGSKFRVLYKGNTNLTTDTSTGKHISIFGYIFSNNQAKIDLEIDFYWEGASWNVVVKPDCNVGKSPFIESSMILNSAVISTKIVDKAITLSKIEDVAEGNIIIGNNTNRPSALDISTDKAVLVGNGTTAVPRVLSGDVTMSNTGVVTIADGVVTEDMLAFTLGDIIYTDFEISSAQLLDLFTTPVTVVPAAGANTLIIPIECWAFLDYNSATYAAGGAVHLAIGTVSCGSIAVTGVTAASDLISKFVLTTAVASGSLLNQDLKVYAATANFTTGDSPLKCRLLYKVISFA